MTFIVKRPDTMSRYVYDIVEGASRIDVTPGGDLVLFENGHPIAAYRPGQWMAAGKDTQVRTVEAEKPVLHLSAEKLGDS